MAAESAPIVGIGEGLPAVFDNCAHYCAVSAPVKELHQRFREPLQRFFASYRLSLHDIEDLSQEVFLRLSHPRGRQVLRQPDAFVFTLARNLVRDRARRMYIRVAKTAVSFEEVELRCERPTPDELLENAQRLRNATAALEGLKPQAQRAFILHRIHGHSYAEIAVDLGVSVSMIEKHVMAAIAVLRRVDNERQEPVAANFGPIA
jgi:RNA polymerase sigma-70 factor (ECF subfamily)